MTLPFAIACPSDAADIFTREFREIEFGSFRSNAWKDPAGYVGRNGRGFPTPPPSQPWFFLEFDQDSGGWDATIGRIVATVKRLDAIADNKTVTFRAVGRPTENAATGVWWYGAKVAVTTEKQLTAPTLVNNWECYVVENSNLTPWDLLDRFDNLTVRAWSRHGNGLYCHATGTINGIRQVWAIRWEEKQSHQRSSGTIQVGKIMDHWISISASLLQQNKHSQGWLLFTETQGSSGGDFYFETLALPNND